MNNSSSLSPRAHPYLSKRKISIRKTTSTKKFLTRQNESIVTINPESHASRSSSKLNSVLYSSRINLKLQSPYARSLQHPASQRTLNHFKDKFSPIRRLKTPKVNIGEHLLPLSGPKAIATFCSQLQKYELSELLDYSDVFYLGLKAKKIQPNIKLKNMGFDNEETDYKLILGDHIAYQFEILESLGAGSFAQVCKCWDHKNNKEVAIKIIKSHARFHDQGQVEVKVLAYLKKYDSSKPSIFVKMLEYFMFRNHLCIVFELLSFTLYDLLKANNFQGFSLTLVKRFSEQLLTGLSFIKKHHIIHCDLKPENIILTSANESSIKIIDFGSSCFENERIYFYIQSRIYRAPEVILGIPYTSSIDMWSFGCIIVELLTGNPLFQGENEIDQLYSIMEVLGPVPEAMLKVSQKKDKLFAEGLPKSFVNSRGKIRVCGKKRLEEKIGVNDSGFLDFVRRCLEWNPELRISPAEAMCHPWMAEGRKFKVVKKKEKPSRSPRSKFVKV